MGPYADPRRDPHKGSDDVGCGHIGNRFEVLEASMRSGEDMAYRNMKL